MGIPLYFLPHAERARDLVEDVPAKAFLCARGLDEVFADVRAGEWCVNEVRGRGPGDVPGVILAAQTPDGRVSRELRYLPETQSWRPCGDPGRLWLGFDPTEPPGPEDLVRHRSIDGYALELGDGRTWTVPVVRRFNGTTNLPRSLGWDAEGTWCPEIRPAYRDLFEALRPVADAFFRPATAPLCELYGEPRDDQGTRSWDLPAVVALCVRLLAVNYRLERHLASALGLVDSSNWQRIFEAGVDWALAEQLVAETQKKSAASV